MQEIILEKIINQLAQDGVIDLSTINDKTITIKITDIGCNICFLINNNKIFIFDELKPSDANIAIKCSAFFSLLNNTELEKLIKEEKVVIVGEVKTVQLLIDILKNNTIKNKIQEILPKTIIEMADRVKHDLTNGKLKEDFINCIIKPQVHN